MLCKHNVETSRLHLNTTLWGKFSAIILLILVANFKRGKYSPKMVEEVGITKSPQDIRFYIIYTF